MQDFRNIEAWQKAHALTLHVYNETHSIPHEEVFGIKAMLRRSAISIATFLAEGSGRDAPSAFAADLQRSIAKCNELEYLVLLAHDLKLLNAESSNALSEETVRVRKMTYGLMKKL